jgi:hypothetical protein
MRMMRVVLPDTPDQVVRIPLMDNYYIGFIENVRRIERLRIVVSAPSQGIGTFKIGDRLCTAFKQKVSPAPAVEGLQDCHIVAP